MNTTRDMDTLLGRLKPQQREIVRSISLNGSSIRETADRVHMTEGAVRVTLHRALKALAVFYRSSAREVATGIRDRCGARRVEPSPILQLVPCVEAKEVGRALSAVGACYLLRFVDRVGERKTMLCRKSLHVVKGVLSVGRGVIRHDGDCADAYLA
jgi:hypothetical protein